MKKKKLQLNLGKKTIATLTNEQQAKIIGGDDAATTSNSDCTHFICCGPKCTEPTCAELDTCGDKNTCNDPYDCAPYNPETDGGSTCWLSQCEGYYTGNNSNVGCC